MADPKSTKLTQIADLGDPAKFRKPWKVTLPFMLVAIKPMDGRHVAKQRRRLQLIVTDFSSHPRSFRRMNTTWPLPFDFVENEVFCITLFEDTAEKVLPKELAKRGLSPEIAMGQRHLDPEELVFVNILFTVKAFRTMSGSYWEGRAYEGIKCYAESELRDAKNTEGLLYSTGILERAKMRLPWLTRKKLDGLVAYPEPPRPEPEPKRQKIIHVSSSQIPSQKPVSRNNEELDFLDEAIDSFSEEEPGFDIPDFMDACGLFASTAPLPGSEAVLSFHDTEEDTHEDTQDDISNDKGKEDDSFEVFVVNKKVPAVEFSSLKATSIANKHTQEEKLQNRKRHLELETQTEQEQRVANVTAVTVTEVQDQALNDEHEASKQQAQSHAEKGSIKDTPILVQTPDSQTVIHDSGSQSSESWKLSRIITSRARLVYRKFKTLASSGN